MSAKIGDEYRSRYKGDTEHNWHRCQRYRKNLYGYQQERYHKTVLMGIMGSLITTGGQRWALCIWLDLIGRGSMNVDDEQHTGDG
jgi:hypothetical protein